METLESSRVCRLCGKHSGISINIFDKNENHVKKINAVLPIMVHEMDLLPKHMCHRCSYKLEEFHKFYIDCLRTDASLKSQLSWMRKEEVRERIGVPMVHIQNIKVEPPDYETYELDPIVENVNYLNSVSFPVNGVQRNGIRDGMTYATYSRCKYGCDNMDQSKRTPSVSYEKTISISATGNEEQENNVDNSIETQAVKRNYERQSCMTSREETDSKVKTKDSKKQKSSSSVNKSSIDISGIKREPVDDTAANSVVIRNLRPRKGVVNYYGIKKKSLTTIPRVESTSEAVISKIPTGSGVKLDVTSIKVEKMQDLEGRTLRPRKEIHYLETRKYVKPGSQKRSTTLDNNNVKGFKVKCNNRMFSSPNPQISQPSVLTIKQELVDNEDITTVDSSACVGLNLPKSHNRIIKDLAALPNNIPVDIQNDCKPNIAKLNNIHNVLNIPNRSEKRLSSNSKGTVRLTSMRLRSRDVYLRNGKIRVLENDDSVRKTSNYHRNIDKGKTNGKTNPRSTSKIMNGAARSKTVNYIDKNIKLYIKQYCEKCDISFANKELFNLHAC